MYIIHICEIFTYYYSLKELPFKQLEAACGVVPLRGLVNRQSQYQCRKSGRATPFSGSDARQQLNSKELKHGICVYIGKRFAHKRKITSIQSLFNGS